MIVNGNKNNVLKVAQVLLTKKIFNSNGHTTLIETVFITGIVFLIGIWLFPETPLFAIHGFTWLVTGPLLCGLRYGVFPALLSVILSTSVLLIAREYQVPWASTGSISTLSLMMLWTGLVVGGFQNYWDRKINKLTVSSTYLDRQLSELTKAYSLVSVSHDQLQEMVVSQISLRDSILDVRKQILDADINIGERNLGDVGAIILRVLSEYGDIQMAALYRVEGNQKINPHTIGVLGSHKLSIQLDDRMLMEAIETKKTVSLKRQLVSEKKYKGSIILAIPIADSTGRIWGIIAVNQMPFRSYLPENIKLISTLAGYIGDLLGRKVYLSNSAALDTELHSFLLQIQRCILDVSEFNIPSVVLGFEFKNKQNYESASALILGRKRGLDQSWSVKSRRNHQVICLLLPLTSESDLDTYKSHILNLLQDRLSIANFQTAGIALYQKMLSPKQSAADVMADLSNELSIDMKWKTDAVVRDIYAIN